jgi:ubiquinone/menaquinone biosynthesis C-methylase UbiE
MEGKSEMLSLLQAFRFADNESDHIKRLLHWADLPIGAATLDLGAGSGFVAAQMLDSRQDLSICLVDKTQTELERADPRLRRHCADICNVPEADKTFDAVICCYAVGYVDAYKFFAEVHRLLRAGGVAFIVDMVPDSPTAEQTSLFGYTIRSRTLLERCASAGGLRPDFYMEPTDDSGWGESHIPGFKILFGEVRPAIWRFKV